MVLSPLGFAGLAIPPLEKYALDWWHRLLAQAFFAPVYLLFIFVAMKMVQGMSSGNVDIESAIANGTTSALGSVAIFAVLIGFLVMALITAKNMGAAGASIATKAAGSAVVGGTAFIGRRTVGRGSSWAADRLNNSKFGRSRTGQMLISGFNYGAKSSFDARGMGKIGSLDLGKAGGKDGYTGELHKKEEARKKAGEKLALTKDEQKNISDTKTAQAALAKEMADRHKEAQAPGQATIADLRAQIKNAPEGSKEREALVQELRSEQEALRTLREEQNAERTTMEAAHKEKLQKLEDAPQREYAEKLTVAPRFSTPGLNVLNPILKVRYKVGISGDADRHTAKTMLKNLKKTPEQRTADKSNKEILDAIHKMGHGGGGDHGGGGGGGGAPKAASGGGGDHH
jgi:hypothetical protein